MSAGPLLPCARRASIRPGSRVERVLNEEDEEIARLNEELEECPFCGDYAAGIVEARGGKYRVECDGCGGAARAGDDAAEAAEWWNDRTPRTRRVLWVGRTGGSESGKWTVKGSAPATARAGGFQH